MELQILLQYALEEAARLGSMTITNDHLFLAIFRHKDNKACSIIATLGGNIELIKGEINSIIDHGVSISADEIGKITLSKDLESTIALISKEAVGHGGMMPESEHVLLALMKDTGSVAVPILSRYGINYASVYEFIRDELGEFDDFPMDDADEDEQAERTDFPTLESYGYDITAAAASGMLDPVIGRKAEIERVIQILGRRKKNNPVLIGEPGVGKSSIVEGLAAMIARKEVPSVLLDKRIVSLDIAAMVAGTKYRGQFEERIKSLLREIKGCRDIILFIDEIHTLVGAGGAAGSLDAANMLKPALARGEIQCIGATTLDEYRQVIEKDGALERRFHKVIVDATTYDETLDILRNIKYKYEEFHNVRYDDDTLKACVSLSTRYITDRVLPDKAIDVMDEAGSRISIKCSGVSEDLVNLHKEIEPLLEQKRLALKRNDIKKAKELRDLELAKNTEIETIRQDSEANRNNNPVVVSPEDIAKVISGMTSIPVSKIEKEESEKLLCMEDALKSKVIGQDEAISKVVKAIRRSRAGIKDPNKPIGTFLFLGPTGVGKTQLAKKLAEYMFDSEENMVRIDMSEYMEKFTVSALVGAPPGYVGYGEGGRLSEKVRRKPYSVVLLDEIEKAHGDIFNILLQVLDEGRLTDSNGRTVDFRNTIVIMTSNVGSRQMKEFGAGVGFKTSVDANLKNIVDKELQKRFAPELLNRIDDKILFNRLGKEDLASIIDIEISGMLSRLKQLGCSLTITDEAKAFISEKGYDPDYGARPLKRAIQTYVEDPVAEAILLNKNASGKYRLTLNKTKDDTIVK